MSEIKPKKERRFLKTLGRVGEILVEQVLLKLGSSIIKKIGGKKTLPSILFIFLSLSLFAQFPNTGNKQRLGFQTTGDGLTWRGSISDTASIQPINNQNTWVILDTINLKFYSFDFTSNTWNALPQGTNIDTTSLSNRINLKLNLSDTASMLTNYLRTGTAASTYVSGSGTTNYLPKFTGTSTLGNSAIRQSGNNIGINTTPFSSLTLGQGKNIMLDASSDSIPKILFYEAFDRDSNYVQFGAQIQYNSPTDRLEFKMRNNVDELAISILRESGNTIIHKDLTVTGATTLSAPLTVNSSAVFNEASADADFRVESDGNANMVFVDASTDRVGIGTNAPTKELDVNGELRIGTVSTTPSALLGKNGSNVVGEVTDINQSGIMKVGGTTATTNSVGGINVAHGLSYTPSKVIATIAQLNSYVIVLRGITSSNLEFTIYDSTTGVGLDSVSVGFYWIAFK